MVKTSQSKWLINFLEKNERKLVFWDIFGVLLFPSIFVYTKIALDQQKKNTLYSYLRIFFWLVGSSNEPKFGIIENWAHEVRMNVMVNFLL